MQLTAFFALCVLVVSSLPLQLSFSSGILNDPNENGIVSNGTLLAPCNWTGGLLEPQNKLTTKCLFSQLIPYNNRYVPGERYELELKDGGVLAVTPGLSANYYSGSTRGITMNMNMVFYELPIQRDGVNIRFNCLLRAKLSGFGSAHGSFRISTNQDIYNSAVNTGLVLAYNEDIQVDCNIQRV